MERQRRDALFREVRKGVVQHSLGYGEHILLSGKSHFKIQLIKLPRRAVLPGVLVAETRRNLKILVESETISICLNCWGARGSA